MSRQIIGLDLDGVIVDNTENKIKFAKELGFNLKPEDTPADFIETVLPEETLSELSKLLYHNPETALQADLISGAKTGLDCLKRSGLKYFLISRRKDPELAITLLKKRGLWQAYFNKSNTFFVAEPEDKNTKAVELGVNVYIDDQPSVLEKLKDVQTRFLFDRFKKFGQLPFGHIKISSWEQFLSVLEKDRIV